MALHEMGNTRPQSDHHDRENAGAPGVALATETSLASRMAQSTLINWAFIFTSVLTVISIALMLIGVYSERTVPLFLGLLLFTIAIIAWVAAFVGMSVIIIQEIRHRGWAWLTRSGNRAKNEDT